MPAVDFRPRDHGGLVYGFFSQATGEPMETLDALFEQGARCAVFQKPDEPTRAYGFAIVTGQQTVAWVHVKNEYRKNGVAKALLVFLGVDPAKPIIAKFFSPMIRSLRRRGYVINPPEKETDAERDRNPEA